LSRIYSNTDESAVIVYEEQTGYRHFVS